MWFVTPEGRTLVNLNHYATISVRPAEGGDYFSVVASNPASRGEIALLNVPSEEDGEAFINGLAEGLRSGSLFYKVNPVEQVEQRNAST